MVLKANIEDIVSSGAAVTGHGEVVADLHAAADGRIESAQHGWQGQSSAAMSARADIWRATTSALLIRMSDHSQGLHRTAHAFAELESNSSQVFEALLPPPGQT